MFIVRHYYEVDGGFGDAVFSSDLVACFEKKEEAEAWAKKYSNEHVYDRPYDALSCGKLKVSELNEFAVPESEMWWLDGEEESDKNSD